MMLFIGLPTEVSGNATDGQPVEGSPGMQIQIATSAVVGCLILLGIILIMAVVCYCHKKRKRNFKA